MQRCADARCQPASAMECKVVCSGTQASDISLVAQVCASVSMQAFAACRIVQADASIQTQFRCGWRQWNSWVLQCSAHHSAEWTADGQHITWRSSLSVAMPFIPPPSMVRIRRPRRPMGALPTAHRTASFSPATMESGVTMLIRLRQCISQSSDSPEDSLCNIIYREGSISTTGWNHMNAYWTEQECPWNSHAKDWMPTSCGARSKGEQLHKDSPRIASARTAAVRTIAFVEASSEATRRTSSGSRPSVVSRPPRLAAQNARLPTTSRAAARTSSDPVRMSSCSAHALLRRLLQ